MCLPTQTDRKGKEYAGYVLEATIGEQQLVLRENAIKPIGRGKGNYPWCGGTRRYNCSSLYFAAKRFTHKIILCNAVKHNTQGIWQVGGGLRVGWCPVEAGQCSVGQTPQVGGLPENRKLY